MSIDAPLTEHRSAPSIETDRLLLRPHLLSDVADCTAMWADPEIARCTIGEPSTPTRTWSRMLAYRGHWAMLGFGYWAIADKESGRYLGEMGFADFKRGVHRALEKMPEAGWVLAAHAHGRGLCTEGLRAILAWSDSHFEESSIACIIQNDNSRSLSIATRLGFMAIPTTSKGSAATTVFLRSPVATEFV
jgi:RimJ/RimL family protein N-acetyltransferase